MSGYKKFEFNNFIIEEDEEIISAEDVREETIEPEPVIIPEKVVEQPVPEIRTYTEEELE